MTADTLSGEATPYRVLARKYRPATFAELVGQEAMVRTLTNAFAQGRLAHAFVLTGVRGVGKTTTARIIAKALNCVGADGKGGPTVAPCGVCEHCVGIANDRDVDVIEMDAASRTGVDDIRELIDGVRYRPISARYKVYIIDEVHMLSKNAFNALLKTLEEPPEHVKFIFATTEIRKVPITVLSRCQRFDLRRVDLGVLAAHLAKVAGAEGAEVPPEAIELIARAADGSVRDGLSLLDQAIAHGAGAPTAEQVRDMLGLADRVQILDLFDHVMKGEIKPALALMADLYKAGADPIVVLQDLLEICHWLTRAKIDPDADGPVSSDGAKARGLAMATGLAMASLSRAWQMLLKGLSETQNSTAPLTAAEMTLIRLAYAAELPSPAELVRSLRVEGSPAQASAGAPSSSSRPTAAGSAAGAQSAPSSASRHAAADKAAGAQSAPSSASRQTAAGSAAGAQGAPSSASRQAAADKAAGAQSAPPSASRQTAADKAAGMRPTEASLARRVVPEVDAAEPTPAKQELPGVETFEALVAMVEAREPILAAHLRNNVHLVRFEPGRLEFRPTEHALANLAPRLTTLLSEWTGRRWAISVSNEAGDQTLAAQAKRQTADRLAEASNLPLVKALLQSFPGAVVENVRERGATFDDVPDAGLDGDGSVEASADLAGDIPMAGDIAIASDISMDGDLET
jgi:DNA polymerase-3 subunit gamma/tau